MQSTLYKQTNALQLSLIKQKQIVSVSYSVLLVFFWKFEVGERFGLKTERVGTAFPRVPSYFNHCLEVI